MLFYKKLGDKKSGDGLSLTDWNDITNAMGGNMGLKLATDTQYNIGIGFENNDNPIEKLDVKGNIRIHGGSDFILGGGGAKNEYGALQNKYPLRLFESYGWNFTLQNDDNTGFRIGPPNETDRTKMNYFVVRKDGKVGIGVENPTIHLAIGDSDTGFNQETDGELAIRTNGVERVRINKDGKFGIGKTDPVESLDVNGNIRISGNSDFILGGGGSISEFGALQDKYPLRLFESHGWNFTLQNDDNTGFRIGPPNETDRTKMNYFVVKKGGKVGIGVEDPSIRLAIGDHDTGINQEGDGKLAFYTNGIEKLRIDEHGNVGIGTTSPTALLHVNGKIKATEFEGNINLGGAGLNFATNSDANVGIGTTTPETKLDVRGDISLLDNLVLQRGGGKGSFNAPADKYPLRLFESHGWNFTVQDSDQSGFRVGPVTATNNLETDYFVVKNGGNIGIGTTDPESKLHIKTFDNVAHFESTGTQAFMRLITSEGPDNRVEFTNRPGGKATIFTGGTDALSITKEGNVGIGVDDPSEKLEVDGNVKITGSLQLLGTLQETEEKSIIPLQSTVLMAPENKVVVGIKFEKTSSSSPFQKVRLLYK